MNIDERAALEALAGRALTPEDDAIIDAALPGRRDDLIAARLSIGRTKLGTVTTERFAAWAAATGMRAVIEDTAVASQHPLRSIALALRDVLVGGATGINFAYPGNPEMLDLWVQAGLLSSANRDGLLALATLPDPITTNQVSDALNGAQGLLTLGGLI